MAKQTPPQPDRPMQPKIERGGKTVTTLTIFEGIAPASTGAAVMAAAMNTDDLSREKLRALLQLPDVLPDFSGKNGITPLMAACATGNAAAVEILSSHPLVNLSRADKDGWTALHYAAACGHPDCVRALLSHHASPAPITRGGETPFDFIGDDQTRDAFWESRAFVRYMKLHHPEHEKFKPVPEAPVAEEPAATPVKPAPPAPDPVKDAFFRAVASVGLQWRAMPAMNVKGALTQKLSEMDEEQFADAYRTIRATGAEFSWGSVFIEAARHGNNPVLRFLHNEILFDQRTLNQALSAAVDAGDLRDTAHHLAIWGASPAAPHELNGVMAAPTIFDAVDRNNRLGVAEELALWRVESIGAEQMKLFAARSTGKAADAARRHDAGEIYNRRREFRKLRGSKLSDAFNQAVAGQNIIGTMAGYAEARRDRFLRGNVEISPKWGGNALAVALRHDRFEFARLLIADGFKLADAEPMMQADIRLRGSPEAKQFAQDHLSGKMKVPNVSDVGRARRAELQILSMPRPGHYGMF